MPFSQVAHPGPHAFGFTVNSDDLAINVSRAVDSLLETLANSRPNPMLSPPSDYDYRSLDTRLRDLDAILEHVQHTISDRKIDIKRKRNSLSPVSQLPVEILTRVFAAAVGRDMDLSWKEQDEDATGRLLELSSVSKLWHDVLESTPQLWSTIEVDCPARTALAVERSEGVPLHIRHQYSPSVRLLPMQELLEPVAGHSLRWKTLHLAGDASDVELALNEHPAPQLEVLNINTSATSDEGPIQYSLPIKLRVLRLNGVWLPWPVEGLPELRVFSLRALPSDIVSSTHDFFAFLSSSPRLEEISFTGLGYNRTRPTLPLPILANAALSLPSLKSLSFERVMETFMASFLRAASTPKLESFDLQTAFPNDVAGEAIVQALTTGGSPTSPLRSTCMNLLGRPIYLMIRPESVQFGHIKLKTDRQAGVHLNIPHANWIRNVGQLVTVVGLPTQLWIHRGRGNETGPNEFKPILYAEWMQKVAHIHVSSRMEMQSVLQALLSSVPPEGGAPVVWPCPSLSEIRLTQINVPEGAKSAITEQARALAAKRSDIRVYDAGGRMYTVADALSTGVTAVHT